MRAQASLLLSEGHPHAARYPLATLWLESQIIRERIGTRQQTESMLMQAMLTAVISPKDAARKRYEKLLRKLM